MINHTNGTCGCCGQDENPTPLPRNNPAGLSAITHRAGSFGAFQESMTQALSKYPVLRQLTIRSTDDPAIALMDSWAVSLEVLSFYGDRIANENYLNTATERRSVLEMASMIGYTSKPGIGATTHLAFTCDEFPGSPETVPVAKGSKAQSIARQGELPQMFETDEEIEARPSWNALKIKSTEDYVPNIGDTNLYLDGVLSTLKPGNALLIVGDTRKNSPSSTKWDLLRIKGVKTVEATEYLPAHTIVTIPTILTHNYTNDNPQIFLYRQRANLFGYNSIAWDNLPVNLRIGERNPDPNAPANKRFLPGAYAYREDSWSDNNFSPTATYLYLDQVYSDIAVKSWVVVSKTSKAELYEVTGVKETTKTDYMMSAQVSRLTISGKDIEDFSPKLGFAFVVTEELFWGKKPITQNATGNTFQIDGTVSGLSKGRHIAVSGKDASTGETVSDVLKISEIAESAGVTQIETETALSHVYKTETVRINANVAPASQGSTVEEILGSGNSNIPFQSFKLSYAPLTYHAVGTAKGYESTLEIRVNGVLWEEVDSFYGHGPQERIYIVRPQDNGTSIVQFGDGVTGLRPTSGTNNITARYRMGSGLAGMVGAGTITQLLTMPNGCSKVTNPLSAVGADDAEELENARKNAPLTVLTLGRVVSRQDFEDYAGAYPGIGKTQAATLWDGEQKIVYLTVATSDGKTVPENGTLAENLRKSLNAARHADHPFRLASYEAVSFVCQADILIDSAYVTENVIAAARAAMESAFNFESRSFSQNVTASEIYALLQSVEGVTAVDLNALYIKDEPQSLENILESKRARNENGIFLPAQLLTLTPDDLYIMEKSV